MVTEREKKKNYKITDATENNKNSFPGSNKITDAAENNMFPSVV